MSRETVEQGVQDAGTFLDACVQASGLKNVGKLGYEVVRKEEDIPGEVVLRRSGACLCRLRPDARQGVQGDWTLCFLFKNRE